MMKVVLTALGRLLSGRSPMMSDLDPFAGLAKVLSALPGLPETVQLAALGTVCFLALVIAVVFLWPKKPRE